MQTLRPCARIRGGVAAPFAARVPSELFFVTRALFHSPSVKFPPEGAGLLSSLVDTDGVVDLGEDVTRVEPGTIVSCLPCASLL